MSSAAARSRDGSHVASVVVLEVADTPRHRHRSQHSGLVPLLLREVSAAAGFEAVSTEAVFVEGAEAFGEEEVTAVDAGVSDTQMVPHQTARRPDPDREGALEEVSAHEDQAAAMMTEGRGMRIMSLCRQGVATAIAMIEVVVATTVTSDHTRAVGMRIRGPDEGTDGRAKRGTKNR